MSRAQVEKRGSRPLPFGSRWSAIGFALFLGWGCATEMLGFAARVYASRASSALNAQQPGEAFRYAESALALNPWNDRATFTRCTAFRNMNRPEISAYAEEIARWHPQRALLMLMAGEARLTMGEPTTATRDLWAGFWAVPITNRSPELFWRHAWQAGLKSAGRNDAQTSAALEMTKGIVLQTPDSETRRRILGEIEAEYGRQ